MNWRIIKQGKNNSAYNMALDEAILLGVIKKESPPTIRFYDWSPPTASCGYNQKAEKEVDFAELNRRGYGFVRRPTGGRLVLHKNEITYSVIAPASGFLNGSITHTYSEISKALAKGLQLMGINVALEKGALSSVHQREVGNPCFTSTSRYELAYKRKKIVGSAQVRKENCFLQHGSILLNENQGEVGEILPNLDKNKKEKIVNYLKKKTIAINEILSFPIDFRTAVDFLIQGFILSWDTEFFNVENKLFEEEKKMTEYLIKSKYSSEKWNKKL